MQTNSDRRSFMHRGAMSRLSQLAMALGLALAATSLSSANDVAASSASATTAERAGSAALLLDQSRRRYPAAAQTPRSQAGWQHVSNKVEADAPRDEAAGGVSALGAQLIRRTQMCFPTETRNLFYEVDQVADGGTGPLRPIDYAPKGQPVSEEARKAIQGQNTWMLWGEGNEAFWGWLQEHGYGIADFLILIDSDKRDSRFKRAGLINQPGMTKGVSTVLGLRLDQGNGARVKMVPPPTDIDARTGKVAEVVQSPGNHRGKDYREFFKIGDEEAYAKAIAGLADDGADPRVYGYPSGVVGLRLMLNPDFFGDSKAAATARAYWKQRVEVDNGKAYYEKDEVRADPMLVRPFRVSMACSFCHVAPHPLNPPADPEAPLWANLSSVIGNQYWTPPETFSNIKTEKSFLWQFVASQQPGTIDTSLVSTDHINNPNTINAIFEVNARLERAKQLPPEQQSEANLRQPGEAASLPGWRSTPRVLLDGADSIGMFGALSRVYLNIGAYSEQWRHLHNPVIGFKPQRPFELATMQDKSIFWQTTERFRTPQLTAFFTHVGPSGNTPTQAMKLAATPEGKARIERDQAQALEGRNVFLRECAVCHSSKQPVGQQLEFSRDWRSLLDPTGVKLTLPMDFAEWDAFRAGPAYKAYLDRLKAFAGDEKSALFAGNYLSTDVRVPITLVGTNSQRAVGTNGMRGQVWDNFSSETYKSLPSVGRVPFFNPYKSAAGVDAWGNNDHYVPPAGGPGYYRPASLASLWTSAPLLHNNALGLFNRKPSVAGRLESFDDSLDKMMNRALRLKGSALPGDLRAEFAKIPELRGQPGFSDVGFIYRTTARSDIDFRAPFIRPLLEGILGSTVVSILTLYVWVVLGAGAVLLAFFARARLAGSLLALFAAVVAALLRGTGVDTIHLWLWLIPLLAVAGALAFFLQPAARLAPKLLFGALGVALLLTGFVLNAFVDGRSGDISLGPIPKGTPVNLIMNMNPEAPKLDLFKAVSGLARGILRVRKEALQDERFEALKAFQEEAADALLKVSKCPDFVMDRGHFFAEGLSDAEKAQLKAFLATL